MSSLECDDCVSQAMNVEMNNIEKKMQCNEMEQ